MTAFNTTITLPELTLRNLTIGGNKLLRFAARIQQIEITIDESEQEGWYVLKTKLPFPYNTLYLRKPKKRKKTPVHGLCLELTKSCEISTLNQSTKLQWIQHPAMNDTRNPYEIVSSWQDCFQFREDKPEQGQIGLRTPQLGALHAISAYFSLKRNEEPATVVLPTGTGKTETMLSLMIYRQLPKILVIVPSNSLRNQIADKFCGLGCLSMLGVIPIDTALPIVASITNGIKSITDAQELLQHANVFVATVSVLNSSEQKSIDHLCELDSAVLNPCNY